MIRGKTGHPLQSSAGIFGSARREFNLDLVDREYLVCLLFQTRREWIPLSRNPPRTTRIFSNRAKPHPAIDRDRIRITPKIAPDPMVTRLSQSRSSSGSAGP
jgi:hypothetical protein